MDELVAAFRVYAWIISIIQSSFVSASFPSILGPDGLLTFVDDFLSLQMSAASVEHRMTF